MECGGAAIVIGLAAETGTLCRTKWWFKTKAVPRETINAFVERAAQC